jgi:hypothetical protein
MSKERLNRLKSAAARGLTPTSKGDRKAETRGPGALAAANKFFKSTNTAAKAIKENRRKSDMKDYD